jgi:hypothetical protein
VVALFATTSKPLVGIILVRVERCGAEPSRARAQDEIVEYAKKMPVPTDDCRAAMGKAKAPAQALHTPHIYVGDDSVIRKECLQSPTQQIGGDGREKGKKQILPTRHETRRDQIQTSRQIPWSTLAIRSIGGWKSQYVQVPSYRQSLSHLDREFERPSRTMDVMLLITVQL